MSDKSITEVINEERDAWSKQFGGGMVGFDEAFFEARHEEFSIAEAQQRGAAALLDAFVARLHQRLSREGRIYAR